MVATPKSQTEQPPLLHEPTGAARRLSVGRSKMFELIATGEIESIKIGRKRLIPDDALIEYVQRMRKVQTPAAEAA